MRCGNALARRLRRRERDDRDHGGRAAANATPATQRVARLDRIAEIPQPTGVAQPRGDADRLFITTKPGRIYVLDDGKLEPEPFLDLKDEVNNTGSEQGMFSIAFAPDYAKSGRFYTAYTLSDNSVQVSEFERSDDSPLEADPDSERAIINAYHGAGHRTQHNGGELQFGPDGDLYLGFGDGGPVVKPFVSNRAQRRAVLLGKILRIDPLHPKGGLPYAIPPTTRSSATPASGLRSTPTVCETRSASRSTRRPAPWRSATSARPTSRRSTTCPRAAPRAPTSAGPRSRATARSAPTTSCSATRTSPSRSTPTPTTGAARCAEDDRSEGLRLSPSEVFGIVSFGQGSDGRIYAASFNGGAYALNPK